MLFALAHDAEGRAFGAVDGDVQLDRRLVAEPARRMSSRATLLCMRSWFQTAWDFSLIGVKRSLRMSEACSLIHVSAALSGLTLAAPFWAFVAWASQAARTGVTGFQRSSLLASSVAAAARSASIAATRGGALDSRWAAREARSREDARPVRQESRAVTRSFGSTESWRPSG